MSDFSEFMCFTPPLATFLDQGQPHNLDGRAPNLSSDFYDFSEVLFQSFLIIRDCEVTLEVLQ